MGCTGSKDEAATPADKPEPTDAPAGDATPEAAADSGGGVAPPGATPPSVKAEKSASTLDPEEVKNKRISIHYQSKEIDRDQPSTARRSSAPFDKARIGTHTRHGVMPGPRGIANAKINQDRGVVCWPFHGSMNEALLCVFDGHGPKGEKASEFCMTVLPEMLEKDHDALVKDPVATLTKHIVELDKKLLSDPTLGTLAMSCGTTSNVIYMKGTECWVACSGDSRAIKASRVGGKVVATDLSQDHKPDLPEEQKRIEAAGGMVTPSGPGGRPSRVWANGRVGLAMSRSIGDGECKKVGVIPDPEIQKFNLKPTAPDSGEDGDIFVIVASDGVWEFIDSQEAADIVSGEKEGAFGKKAPVHATEACEVLVQEAAARWRREEGNYRDDITAIITFLPFLEDWGDEVNDEAGPGESPEIFINQGAPGISKMASGEESPNVKGTTKKEWKVEHPDEPDEGFVKRRLSVTNPLGDDDADWENGEVGDDVEA